MSAAANLKVASEATAHDLWRVAETGCPAELETILLRGVDVDATDDKGITALIRAACCGNSPVVHALLNHGANLNLTRSDGFTPLMLAAFYGHADVVSMLVERGADPSIGTRSRTSAAMWASARGFFRIAEYLKHPPRSASPNSAAKSQNESQSDPRVESEDQDTKIAAPIEDKLKAETAAEVSANQPDSRSEAVTDATVVSTLKQPPEVKDQLRDNEFQANPQVESTDPDAKNIATPDQEESKTETLMVPAAKEPDLPTEPNTTSDARSESLPATRIVRPLTSPPEIWDLVNEIPPAFDPRSAFVERVRSIKENLLWKVLSAIAVAVILSFSLFKVASSLPTVPKQNLWATGDETLSSSSLAKSATVDTANKPGVAPENAALNEPLTDSLQPMIFDSRKHTAHQGVTSRFAEFRATSSEESSLLKNEESRLSAEAPTGETVISAPGSTRDVAAVRNSQMSNENDSRAPNPATKKSDPTLSPQLIAAPTRSSITKAKVIQWP